VNLSEGLSTSLYYRLFRAVCQLGCVMAIIAQVGCGYTQITPANREMITELATAISVKDLRLVLEFEKRLNDGINLGTVAFEEAKAFRSIIELAKKTEWEEARKQVYGLREGQNPTADDLQKVMNRQMPEIRKIQKKAH